MAGPIFADLVEEYTSTAGSGTLELAGAVNLNRRVVSSEMANGDWGYFYIRGGTAGEWEVSKCTYTSSGNYLTRNTVYKSSNGNTTVNFSGDEVIVRLVAPANWFTDRSTPSPVISSPAYAATITADASSGAPLLIRVGALTGNITLGNPTSPVNGQQIEYRLKQDGTGGRTLTLGDKFRLPLNVSGSIINLTANSVSTICFEYDLVDDKFDLLRTSATPTQADVDSKLPLAGGTMAGSVDMDENDITNISLLSFKDTENVVDRNLTVSYGEHSGQAYLLFEGAGDPVSIFGTFEIDKSTVGDTSLKFSGDTTATFPEGVYNVVKTGAPSSSAGALAAFQDTDGVTVYPFNSLIADVYGGLQLRSLKVFDGTYESTITASLTGNHSVSMPDASGTLALQSYVDSLVTGLLDFKGSTDCSADPNYPTAVKGDAYLVSVTGKIGGASGTSVDAGDWFVALADNAGGTEASVGSSWGHMEHNLPTLGALATLTPGTDVATALVVNVGSAGAVVVNGGALGTPASGDLANCTGLPVAGGGSGRSSTTAYAPIFGGTTSTAAEQSGTAGTAGQVLKSGGASAIGAYADDIAAVGFTAFDATAVTTGKVKGFVVARYAATIAGFSFAVDAGTATVKVWKIASGTAKPTSANSINTSGVAISTGTALVSTTVSDFTTTAVAAGDIFAFNIEAISGVTEITFQLHLKKL